MKYKCPKCFNDLEFSGDKLYCQKCSKDWSQGNGFPDFIEEEFYWGEIPQKLMQEICDYAKKHDWNNALEKKLLPDYPKIYKYVTESNRADWKILLPLNKDSVVLDIGAGWGTISSFLSDYVKEVHALEGIKERVEFINIRKSQEGKGNIYPLRANFNNPPFFDESFDVIICNGVLEWVGMDDISISPMQAQIDFLKKLRSNLKQNGMLYIGIENRFSYGSFYGTIDHSGLPYTNLLPRKCADLVVKFNASLKGKTRGFFLSNQKGYRTYTYSFKGYRKLLEKAGFADMRIYFAIPSYNSPSTLIPIDNPEIYRFYLKTMRPYPLRITKRVIRKTYEFLINFGIQKWFENAFSIIAIK